MNPKRHYLKRPSSFIVVVLRSLMHKGCVCCGKPINSFDESVSHWLEELEPPKRLLFDLKGETYEP